MPGVSAWPGRSRWMGVTAPSTGVFAMVWVHGLPSGPLPVEWSRFSMSIATGAPVVAPWRTPDCSTA